MTTPHPAVENVKNSGLLPLWIWVENSLGGPERVGAPFLHTPLAIVALWSAPGSVWKEEWILFPKLSTSERCLMEM